MVSLSTGITSYPFNRLPINMARAQTSTWDTVAWFHSSAQKSKRPHPGTQNLNQIPEGGEAMEVKCPTYARGLPFRA